jgi:thiamine kinase-like enzyme
MDTLLQVIEKAVHQEKDDFTELNWTLKRIYGGMNGIIYYAENPQISVHPLAVKIRKRGERQRATREFYALKALHDLSVSIAPRPISLHTDINTLEGDVVICEWVEGDVLDNLSDAPFDLWEKILTAFCKLHTIQQTNLPHIIDSVSLNRSTYDVVADMERRYDRLPDGQLGLLTKADIRHLIDDFYKQGVQHIEPIKDVSLITCDANPSNMIHYHNQIILIDWENSGWGDPASDIADLLVRPNCGTLPDEMRQKIISRYAEMMKNPQLSNRILAYGYPMLIIWLILTSSGFGNAYSQRFKGVRTFSLEQRTKQQSDYIQRIEKVRSS